MGKLILKSIAIQMLTGDFEEVISLSSKNFSGTDNSYVFEANLLRIKAFGLMYKYVEYVNDQKKS